MRGFSLLRRINFIYFTMVPDANGYVPVDCAVNAGRSDEFPVNVPFLLCGHDLAFTELLQPVPSKEDEFKRHIEDIVKHLLANGMTFMEALHLDCNTTTSSSSSGSSVDGLFSPYELLKVAEEDAKRRNRHSEELQMGARPREELQMGKSQIPLDDRQMIESGGVESDGAMSSEDVSEGAQENDKWLCDFKGCPWHVCNQCQSCLSFFCEEHLAQQCAMHGQRATTYEHGEQLLTVMHYI